jgi:hypothetical protein
MKVIFINKQLSIDKQKVVTNIINQLANCIPLPDKIEVEFQSLGPSSYGETVVTPSFTKRIILNSDLTPKELFYPTIHELVHVSQIHQGKLGVSRTGVYVWENKTYPVDPLTMSYRDYQELPWEQDANHQQKILAKKLLENQSPT